MLRSALIVCVLILLSKATAAQELESIPFERSVESWNLLDLNGDGNRELLVFHQLEEEGRPYSFAMRGEDGWQVATGMLDRGVVALALGGFGLGEGRQLAAIYTDVVGFLALDESVSKLVAAGPTLPFENLIRTASSSAPPIWQWPQDIDGDGHHDLVLPGDAGLVVYFSDGAGEFSEPLVLEMPGHRRVAHDSTGHLDYERSYPRPVFRDLDADGREDMVWFDAQGLGARLQKKARVFDQKNELSFELSWLSETASGVFEQTEVDLKDLDGDGLPDLFLSRMTTPASGLDDLRTTLVVLKNRGKELFSRSPDFALRVQGVVGSGPSFEDIDGDGRLDLVFGSYGAKMSDALQRLLGAVRIDFHVHLGREGALFENQPSLLMQQQLTKQDFERWGARRNFKFGEDLDGDGIADLMRLARLGSGKHGVEILKGGADTKGKPVFGDAKKIGPVIEKLRSISVRRVYKGRPAALVLLHRDRIDILQP